MAVGCVLTTGAGLVLAKCSARDQLDASAEAQSAKDAEQGYIHASIRMKPYSSYVPPYLTFSKARLTPREVTGIERGEYSDLDVMKNGVKAESFFLGVGGQGGLGQNYFVDLVSDSSSMITVTDLKPVDVDCRASKMMAALDTPSEGLSSIAGVTFVLRENKGLNGGLISDSEDPNWGKPFFEHHTIVLGGGADAQTLQLTGVAPPGNRCTWKVRAEFTTDDGERHQAVLNEKPLTTEAGPGKGANTQHLAVDVGKVIKWACDHGELTSSRCRGVQ
ncbi:hypothetical protein ABZ593_20905 [Streptomyces sp. NPDC012617]|uniref:hypothetical protein n=1 Tax=Streptomyces TaxID=1883 RepID=UPI0033CA97A4